MRSARFPRESQSISTPDTGGLSSPLERLGRAAKINTYTISAPYFRIANRRCASRSRWRAYVFLLLRRAPPGAILVKYRTHLGRPAEHLPIACKISAGLPRCMRGRSRRASTHLGRRRSSASRPAPPFPPDKDYGLRRKACACLIGLRLRYFAWFSGEITPIGPSRHRP